MAGEAPALYDVSSISENDVGKIVPIAIVAIGLVLALVLRSLVAPLYLILSVLLSYLASLGISVIVFMKIPGQAGIIFLLPFLMFIFLLALGEDYNILVMTRIREEAGGDTLRRAVVRAVGATGPTVTSAGLVLAGTFVVLAVVGGSGQGNGEIRVMGSVWPSASCSTPSSCGRCSCPPPLSCWAAGTGGRRPWAGVRPLATSQFPICSVMALLRLLTDKRVTEGARTATPAVCRRQTEAQQSGRDPSP